MKVYLVIAFSLVMSTAMICGGAAAWASGIDPGGQDLHYAWGENVDWIDLNSGFGVL